MCRSRVILVLQLLAATAMFAVDRFVKIWAAANKDDAPLPLIPGLVSTVYAENTGAAFSFFEDGRIFFLIVTAAAMCAIVWALVARWPRHQLGAWAMALILSGAMGNFIDRLLQGYVVDMFRFDFIKFAIFNVADIFITIGGILFCIYLLFMHEKNKKRGKGRL